MGVGALEERGRRAGDLVEAELNLGEVIWF